LPNGILPKNTLLFTPTNSPSNHLQMMLITIKDEV